MKYIIILSLFLFCNCASQKNFTKSKTINNNHFKITYPKSWVKFGAMGNVFLMPKKLKKENLEDEFNNISVNKNVFNVEKFIGVEKTLEEHANTLRRNEIKKEAKIEKLEEGSKFVYTIESLVTYKLKKKKYKRLEFFYVVDNKLDYISLQIKESLFDIYFDEALAIINSFEPKK